MVRGRPFEGAGERYEWAFSDQIVHEIEVAVVAAAADLARLELDAGSPRRDAALRAGLKAFPDEGLCSLWLEAAAAIDPARSTGRGATSATFSAPGRSGSAVSTVAPSRRRRAFELTAAT